MYYLKPKQIHLEISLFCLIKIIKQWQIKHLHKTFEKRIQSTKNISHLSVISQLLVANLNLVYLLSATASMSAPIPTGWHLVFETNIEGLILTILNEVSQLAIICSKLTIEETLEQGVKYVKS